MEQARVISQLEEKLKKMNKELEEMRLAIDKLSKNQEGVHVENLNVESINFNLDSINIHEVSGALNIGMTQGVDINKIVKSGVETIPKELWQSKDHKIVNRGQKNNTDKSADCKKNSSSCKIKFN